MSTRNKLNLLLAVVLAILVVVAMQEPGLQKTAPAATLLDLQPDQVKQVRIVKDDEISLLRTAQGWQLQEPLTMPANSLRVEQILELVQAYSEASYPAAAFDLSTVGLAPPQLLLYFNEQRIEFGATEALKGLRYLKVGDRVHLVEDGFLLQLDTPAASFVSSFLVPRHQQLERLQLPALTLSLQPAGWQTEQDGFSTDQLVELVNRWQALQALSVTSVTSSVPDGPQVQLFLQGAEQPLVYVIDERDGVFSLINREKNLRYQLPDVQKKVLLAE